MKKQLQGQYVYEKFLIGFVGLDTARESNFWPSNEHANITNY